MSPSTPTSTVDPPPDSAYPPIGDYGYLSDCHSAALVSRDGSIDWCAMPRVDAAPCFARLLDFERGGYFQIRPRGPYEVRRRYVPDSLVLETTFVTELGAARLVDALAMRHGGRHAPRHQLLRLLEGIEGEVALDVRFEPRFDYGAVRPWIRRVAPDVVVAIGGAQGLLLSTDVGLTSTDLHGLAGSCTLTGGEVRRFSLLFRPPEQLDREVGPLPALDDVRRHLEETVGWWEAWSGRGGYEASDPALTRRSAIVLKGLTNAPTGAIAAAATTSLPEVMGGNRNWDYRFSWIRDSVFAVRALAELGHVEESEGYRRFVQRSAAGSAEEVQILFGVGGERRLHEYEIPELSGYGGSSPVRVGNAAESQEQLDVYGELLDLAFQWHLRGNSPDADDWKLLTELVRVTIARWRDPDRGIWEVRGAPRHFVHSKALCWAALDCGIRLAEDLGHPAPLGEWREEREAIRRAIDAKGYDPRRGIFVRDFDHDELDASLLLLPVFRYVPFTDERMVRTTTAIRDTLGRGGLVRRYASGGDSLEGEEGSFVACAFWLCECLARQGRLAEAREAYDAAAGTANDLGLFAEEFDAARGQMLGNFPQALSHLSQISAAVALAEALHTPSPSVSHRSTR